MTEKIKYAIIGGGVVGTAVAYQLSQKNPNDVFVFERNRNIKQENQSSRNSGVIHAGIYYPKQKGPNKARFCVEGNKLLYDFCQEHKVPHKKTGKFLVASNKIEEEYLDDVLKTAKNNGVWGTWKVPQEEVSRIEPHVKCSSALYVATSGIIEPTKYVHKMYSLALKNESNFVFGSEVIDIKPKRKGFQITTKQNGLIETFEAEYIINAAGLYSDEIAKMVNPDSPYKMDPVRGEAAKFYKTKRSELNMAGLNVYPAPYGFYNDTGKKAEVSFKEFQKLLKEKKITKTVGVHLTPTFDLVNGDYVIGSTVTMGPTSTVGIGKEDYGSNLHPESHYYEKVKNFFPNLNLEDILLHQAGIRAKLKDHYDFVIEHDLKNSRFINLVGIDSPGLTSSLAIAKQVEEMLKWC